jgi:hypothetical protein
MNKNKMKIKNKNVDCVSSLILLLNLILISQTT